MARDYFWRKVGMCLMIAGFGVAVIFLTFVWKGDPEYDARMNALSSRGVHVVGRLQNQTPMRDGLDREYIQQDYAYEVNKKTYVHSYTFYPQWNDDPPGETLELTYFPEDPTIAYTGVRDRERGERDSLIIGMVFIVVGSLLMFVTFKRRNVHLTHAMQERKSAVVEDPAKLDRVFNYRAMVNLVVGSILILVCVPFGIFGVLAASRVEVEFNGVPGDSTFQLLPAVFFAAVPAVFVVIGLIMLLSYFNERIVWSKGWISWYDRFGKLKVRAPIAEIYDVYREDTWFRTNDDDGGDGNLKRRIERIVIETSGGRIVFLDTVPWAPVLESWAHTERNKPVQDAPTKL